MICQCKHIWPSDTTSIGCGEHCLNRMLNIECVAVSGELPAMSHGVGQGGACLVPHMRMQRMGVPWEPRHG